MDTGNLLGSLVTLLRAAKPPHAYEVKGVLMRGSGKQSYGVTLQVTRLPSDAVRVETLWDTSWVRVLRRAADHATAAILTRTRRCGSPWAAWRRYPMPGELFHDYERAAELEDERRYDEALDRYYRALEHDPLNLGLRLQIGFLQEKIGLPLDALATYEGMETVVAAGWACRCPAACTAAPPGSSATRRWSSAATGAPCCWPRTSWPANGGAPARRRGRLDAP